MRRFVHLLEQSQHDFWEEAEGLRLRGDVVRRIRSNQRLESDLNLMDIKIGLLVRNRITLQVRGHEGWGTGHLGSHVISPPEIQGQFLQYQEKSGAALAWTKARLFKEPKGFRHLLLPMESRSPLKRCSSSNPAFFLRIFSPNLSQQDCV